MNIGILAFGQPQAQRVREAAEAHGPVVWVNLADDLAGLVIDRRTLSWRGFDLASLDRVWVHGFHYTNPVIPANEEDTEWAVWQYRYLADQQRFSAWYSLFCELARRGVAVWHAPQVHLMDFMKHAQLSRLRQGGLAIPDMVCVNRREDAEAFMARHPRVVWRPATGRAGWQLFLHRQLHALVDPAKPPVLLAEAGQGSLLRVWLLQGQPGLCLAQHAPSDEAFHETLERLQQTAFVPALADLTRAAAILDLPWCMITFLWDGARATFYDVDPDPLLGWLPPLFHDHLVSALAASLLNLPLPTPPTTLEPLERPTLFLRRMTRILFEFESSKFRR